MSDMTVKLDTPIMASALVFLGGFVFLFYNMYVLAGTDQAQLWERRLALYEGIEAIAFTAAGYLFGKEVHREQASKAEQRADAKSKEVEEAKAAEAAANARGHHLKELIETKHSSVGVVEHEGSGGGGGAIARSHLDELAEFARRLFP